MQLDNHNEARFRVKSGSAKCRPGLPAIRLVYSEKADTAGGGARKLLTGVRSDRTSVHVFPRYEVSSLLLRSGEPAVP